MSRHRRILLHPGFHRTGTRSVGAFLATNRAALAPHLGLLLAPDLAAATALTTNFATDRNPLRLTDMVEVLDGILAENGLHPVVNDTRDMVISAADLTGLMPGAPGIDGYGAAPVATAYLTGYLADRFPQAEIVVVFTTRTSPDWLYSCWRAALFRHRLKQDWPTFRTALAGAANLDDAVVNAARAIDPVTVYSLPLDVGARHRHGPGGALLEMIDLPEAVRGSFEPGAITGQGAGPDLAARFLALNRSDLPRRLLVEEKALLMRAAGSRDTGPLAAPDAGMPLP